MTEKITDNRESGQKRRNAHPNHKRRQKQDATVAKAKNGEQTAPQTENKAQKPTPAAKNVERTEKTSQHAEKPTIKTEKSAPRNEKVSKVADAKKADGKVQRNELRALLLKSVEEKEGQLKKKDLFNVCLSRFNLTAAEKRDHSPDGKLNVCRSNIGQVVTELVAEEKIVIDADGTCRLPKVDPVGPDADVVLKESLEKYVPTLFADGKSLTKKEILDRCVAGYPKAKAQSVRCEGGKALNALKENGKINQDKKNGTYYLEERFPNTPLGKVLRMAYEGGNVKKCFIDALNLSGGPFFEQFSVELLKKEFSSAGTVEKAEVTGGPDDGGIDGKIVYRDGLGFRETVLLQAKLRNVTKSENKSETGKQITLKEVREFFGAAVAAKGTRYVWITTTTFCREAKSFIEKQPDFIGINKDLLFDLAKKHGVGVTQTDGKEELDYKKFL